MFQNPSNFLLYIGEGREQHWMHLEYNNLAMTLRAQRAKQVYFLRCRASECALRLARQGSQEFILAFSSQPGLLLVSATALSITHQGLATSPAANLHVLSTRESRESKRLNRGSIARTSNQFLPFPAHNRVLWH